MKTADRDAISFHLAFFAITVILLVIGVGGVGWRILALVIGYNVALPVVGVWRGHREWLRVWGFGLAVSVLMVLPDWFLSAELGVLVFPDTGGPFIGGVPVFMAGMWAIPLFMILWIGEQIAARRGEKAGIAAAALVALVVLVGSEATLWAVPVWYAQDVLQVAHVAVYIVVPEILLGASALLAYRMTSERPVWVRVVGALVVMVLYQGNATLWYFLVERVVGG